MDSAKNVRWITPFNKFGMVRANPKKTYNKYMTLYFGKATLSVRNEKENKYFQ